MKKLLLVFIAVALVGALLALFLSGTLDSTGGSRGTGATGPGDAPADASAVKAHDKAKNSREKAADAPPALLAIAGVVRSGGQPVAGAVVDAFTVPEGASAVPDE